jgi:hypothetical protein
MMHSSHTPMSYYSQPAWAAKWGWLRYELEVRDER